MNNIKNKTTRVSLEEKILFIKRLSLLLKANIPIVEALSMIEKQTSPSGLQNIIHAVLERVDQGVPLSAALLLYERTFGVFVINIIRIGESSGSLHENLLYLSDELKKKKQLRQKITSALLYPLFIVVATLGITVLLTVYVFPKIIPILEGFHGKLPFTTRVLMAMSNLFIHRGLLLLALVVLLAVVCLWLFKKPVVRFWFDGFVLRIPLFGGMLRSYHSCNICRTLGTLLKNQVPISRALEIVIETTENRVYEKNLRLALEKVKAGQLLSQQFSFTFLFPVMLPQMVHVGERTGDLSGSCMYLAEIYEQELEDLTKSLASLIEPVLMVCMGLLIGFVAVSIITPIYQLTQNLTGIK